MKTVRKRHAKACQTIKEGTIIDKSESIYATVLAKKNPELSEDERGQMLHDIALRDEKKHILTMRYKRCSPKAEELKSLIAEMRTQLLNTGDRIIQHWMIYMPNKMIAVLLMFSEDDVRNRIFDNMTRRLGVLIRAEIYACQKWIPYDESLYIKAVRNIRKVWYSKEMTEFKSDYERNREEQRTAKYAYNTQIECVRWNKKYMKFGVASVWFFSADFWEQGINSVRRLMRCGSFEAAFEAAFELSKKSGGQASVMISGIRVNEDNDSEFLSFVLRENEEGRKVYKRINDKELLPEIRYDFYDEFKSIPIYDYYPIEFAENALEETSMKELADFCEQLSDLSFL